MYNNYNIVYGNIIIVKTGTYNLWTCRRLGTSWICNTGNDSDLIWWLDTCRPSSTCTLSASVYSFWRSPGTGSKEALLITISHRPSPRLIISPAVCKIRHYVPFFVTMGVQRKARKKEITENALMRKARPRMRFVRVNIHVFPMKILHCDENCAFLSNDMQINSHKTFQSTWNTIRDLVISKYLLRFHSFSPSRLFSASGIFYK